MTNEEIAVQIRNGRKDLILPLWLQVERFVRKMAGQRLVLTEGFGGVEISDLTQSGFLAMLRATYSFDESKGYAFTTWLGLHLRGAFSEAAGLHTKRERMDPINSALPLETPLGDEDGATFADIVPDPAAVGAFEKVEEQDAQQALRNALEKALKTLPERQEDALRMKYYRGGECDRKAHDAALRSLRHPLISRQLRQYVGV